MGEMEMNKVEKPNTKEYRVYQLLVRYSGRVLKHNRPIKQLTSECISDLVSLYDKL